MSAILDSKLVERVKERLDAEDAKAIELLTGGNLRDWAETKYSYGYRRALADAKTILNEAYEEIMKE